MARIVITIEDSPDGKKVFTKIDPSGEMIAKRIIGGEKITSAHGLALAAFNAILLEKKRQQKGTVILPKLLT
jgi:hypothetical protein